MSNEAKKLARLSQALVADIFDLSDEEVIAEFRETHGDPDRNATEMRELFEQYLKGQSR